MSKSIRLMLAALFLAGCAGQGAGHLTCYKLNGEVMYDEDVRTAYVSDNGIWRVTADDGTNSTVTGDCVYFARVSP